MLNLSNSNFQETFQFSNMIFLSFLLMMGCIKMKFSDFLTAAMVTVR